MPNNHYQTLEVDRHASLDVIEAAYRRLALRYHPDRNPAPDAVGKMQQLNAAYAVLRDPAKREQYDSALQAAESASSRPSTNPTSDAAASSRSSTRQYTPQINIPVCCQSCGRTDTTLRLAAFPYVVSIILVTLRRSWSGLYCRHCRQTATLQAKFLSFLFGWWGFPWGPIYTLGALFGSNNGFVPADANAQYLKQLGLFFFERGDQASAREVWSTSLHYVYDLELDTFYRRVFGDNNYADESKSEQGGWGGLLAAGVVIVVVMWLIWSCNQTTAPGSSQSVAPSPTVTISSQATPPLVAAPQTPRRATPDGATDVPVITPIGQVANGVVAIHSGPYQQRASTQNVLVAGEEFEVIGQFADCNWLQIRSGDAITGWIPLENRQILLSMGCQEIPPAFFRPVSSSIYQAPGLNGLGELKITNDGELDAVVYLADLSHRPIGVAYVRAHDTYMISQIPDGDYNVYTRSGMEWSGKQFFEDESIERFEDSFNFSTETHSDGSTYYSYWEITITPVFGGNAETEPVKAIDFPDTPVTKP